MEGPSNSWLTSIIRVDWADDEEMVSTPDEAEAVEAVEPLAAEPVTPPEALEPMFTLAYPGDPGPTPPGAYMPKPGCPGDFVLAEPWATYERFRQNGQQPWSFEYLEKVLEAEEAKAAAGEPLAEDPWAVEEPMAVEVAETVEVVSDDEVAKATGLDMRSLLSSGLPAGTRLPELYANSPPMLAHLGQHEQESDHSFVYCLTMECEEESAEEASHTAEEPFGCNG